MDITHLFKASVMTVKVQRKIEMPTRNKNRILQKKCTDDFSKQAKEVCMRITTLRDVLLEHRSAYMRIGQHLKNAAHMTDEQRDLIDRESERFFLHYSQLLAQMRLDWKKIKRKTQRQEHVECVLELLVKYLNGVQHLFLQQKRYRIEYELETYRMLKLAADKKKIPVRPAKGAVQKKKKQKKRKRKAMKMDGDDDATTQSESASESSDKELMDSDVHLSEYKAVHSSYSEAEKTTVTGKAEPEERREEEEQQYHRNGSIVSHNGSQGDNETNEAKASVQQTPQKVALDEDIEKSQQLADEESSLLDPEDIQMFEEENMQLYQEMQGLNEEVEQIEKNVVDIAQLQDIFTEKVSIQQYNIDRISNAVVGATENVKDANDQIRQAIQRNAGMRVWCLFYLLVMSFALLFLDWYYD